MNLNKETKKAQMLIITLVILTILSIVTVSIVVLNNRDIGQVVTNRKYEQAYNVAENGINELVEVYGNPDKSLEGLTGDGCTVVDPNSWYTCTSEVSDLNDDSTYQLQTTIKEEEDISDFSLDKDRSLDINLNGYKESVDLRWMKPTSVPAALELTLLFKDGSGNYKIAKDLFDPGRILSSSNPSSLFVYQTIEPDPANQKNSTRLNITNTISNIIASPLNTTIGLTPSDQTVYLKITPRIKSNGFAGILISVEATNESIFPSQVRHFISSSFDGSKSTNSSTPVANLETAIPLYAQTDGVLDYALLTNGTLKVN